MNLFGLFRSLFGDGNAGLVRHPYAGPSTPKGSQAYASIETQTPWWAARDTKRSVRQFYFFLTDKQTIELFGSAKMCPHQSEYASAAVA